MRDIVFYGAVSLDGYLADRNDQLQWLFDTDTGSTTTYDAFIKTVDTLVMGRITYQETKKLVAGAPLYPDKELFVFSHLPHTFPDAQRISEAPVSFLKNCRKQKGKRSGSWVVASCCSRY